MRVCGASAWIPLLIDQPSIGALRDRAVQCPRRDLSGRGCSRAQGNGTRGNAHRSKAGREARAPGGRSRALQSEEALEAQKSFLQSVFAQRVGEAHVVRGAERGAGY